MFTALFSALLTALFSALFTALFSALFTALFSALFTALFSALVSGAVDDTFFSFLCMRRFCIQKRGCSMGIEYDEKK
jgi:hypothetical protein